MALLSKFFGRTASEGAAFALGTAVGPALTPAVREIINEAWAKFPTHPLDVNALSEIVAEDVELLAWGRSQAEQNGIATDRFDALVQAVENAPGTSELFALWRRGLISEANFEHGLRKARLEPRWDAPLKELRQVLLAPADLAMLRQQGFIERDRQVSESALQGVDAERADLLFEASGLPPGIGEALEMLRRSIINEAEFAQIVREGHTKTKYTDELLQLRHPVLSATQAATLRLKGWITAETSYELGALTGYTQEEMERIYLSMGRPMAPGQMWTALARQTVGPGGGPFTKADFLKAIRESDIRPEYGEALYEIRYTYPPLFQLTRLVQSGAIDADTARDWAVKDRYAPEVVAALHAYWSQPTAATTSGYTDKAKTQLWTATHNSYIAFESNKTAAGSALARLGVPVAERANIFALWDAERELRRKQLTPAQVKKAYRKPVQNPLTGAPWTRDDALAALLERGYSTADANTFLDE